MDAQRRTWGNRPKTPLPGGPLTGKRGKIRRSLSRLGASLNRFLDLLPPGRILHRLLRRGLQWSEVEIPLRRGARALHGLRIAFLSDLHAGSYLNENDLLQIFSEVNLRKPDLVCLGGDLINTKEREILLFRKPLQALDPPLGVFAVPGNHDYFFGRGIGYWQDFLEEQGVGVLVNRGVRIEHNSASLWLAGVDDLTEGKPELEAALAGSRADEPVLLLSHHPDFFFEASAVGIELTLSGHTHGGQICLGNWAPIKHSRFGYLKGLFELEGALLYVSRGVGVTLLPLRLGAPAEIPLLTLSCQALANGSPPSTAPPL